MAFELNCSEKKGKVDRWWEAAILLRELSSVFCGDLQGGMRAWEGGPRGRGYMYTYS